MITYHNAPYVLVSIKKESSDYCRGCLMKSYPSDSKIESFYDIDFLIEKVATRNSQKLEINESGWEFSIISSEKDFNLGLIKNQIEILTKKKIELREEAEKALKFLKDKKAEADQRLIDEAEFERLKQKLDY